MFVVILLDLMVLLIVSLLLIWLFILMLNVFECCLYLVVNFVSICVMVSMFVNLWVVCFIRLNGLDRLCRFIISICVVVLDFW